VATPGDRTVLRRNPTMWRHVWNVPHGRTKNLEKNGGIGARITH
jgi:hypothetical protein